METRKFREKVQLIHQDSPHSLAEHLGWMTIEHTLRINEHGRLRRTTTRNKLICVEVDGQYIPLGVDFSMPVFEEFFPGFTDFGEVAFNEADEYLRQLELEANK
jgi:hypothetical protein